MCGPGARSCLLHQLRFQGGQQQPEGRFWRRLRAGRHSRSPRRVVPAAGRNLHVEPAELEAAARPPPNQPRGQLNEKATFGAQNLSNCKGANMNKPGFATVNPSTGEEIETILVFHTGADKESRRAGRQEFSIVSQALGSQTSPALYGPRAHVEKNKAQLAKVISTEMGKIFSEAEAEVEKCAHEADWYAEHGPKILEAEPAPTGTVHAYVSYLPLGPILAIMPWNFPI